MDNEIKSGKEILDDFFDKINEIPGVDTEIAAALKELYRKDKFTHKNLSNELFELREDATNEQN